MIQWSKKHPRFFISESEALASNGNYKELSQKRDNFFVSHGEIFVRYNGTHRHPILIFYPNSTPYSIPDVYPLDRRLEEQEVIEIAANGIQMLKRDAIRYFYEYRHQNGSGQLCILEADNLDTGTEFYNINTILARVRDWFEGHITGNFPPDSEEVELCAHFNNVNNTVRFFYSDEFMNPEFVEGDFLGVSMYAAGVNKAEAGGAFFGARLTGFTSSGLYKDSEHPIHTFLQRNGFTTATDFVTNEALLKRLVDQGDYLAGYWFEIDNEPKPFREVRDLIDLIGNGDLNKGLQRVARVCLNQIKDLPRQIVFAVRYKNRKRIPEFQLFTLDKKPADGSIILGSSDIEMVSSVVDNYDVKAVPCEKYNEESFFQRNGKRADRKLLLTKTVNVLGAGALGSEIADIMCKAGIGKINIVDNQLMGIQNSVRHLAGMEYMGQPKAFTVKAIVENHNPFASVKAYPLNIKQVEIGLALPEESISISSIADDNTEGYLNEQAVLLNKAVYYVRALRGGKAARIFRVIPGRDACFHCLQLHRQQGTHFIDIPADGEYPTLRNECNNPIRPGSAADLKLISSLSCGLVLEQLSKDSDVNHWVWSTESIQNTPIDTPYKLYPHTIPIHKDCPYCSESEPLTVYIKDEVLADLRGQVLAKSGVETGGVLAGYVDGNICYINYASSGGPNAVEQRDKFEKDVAFCQEFVDNLYRNYGDRAMYVGEWHSHPSRNNSPSNTDLRSLSGIGAQKNYLTAKPVMIIFSSDGTPSCTVHPAGSRFYYTDLNTINTS